MKSFIEAIVHVALMSGQFPSELNPAFAHGLTGRNVKLNKKFINNLESQIPMNEDLVMFIEERKNNNNDLRIVYCDDLDA